MPTSYTAPIHEGKPYSFDEYMLGCAKAFGANINLRDLPIDTPIPVFEPKTEYHENRIQEAKKELAKLNQLTAEEIEQQIEERFDENMQDYNKRIQETQAREMRYQEMLKQVEAWIPPSAEHEEYKQYCKDQLIDSINFDCGYLPEPPVRWDSEDYLPSHIKLWEDDIAYHERRIQEEIERTNKRNQWNNLLIKSLK